MPRVVWHLAPFGTWRRSGLGAFSLSCAVSVDSLVLERPDSSDDRAEKRDDAQKMDPPRDRLILPQQIPIDEQIPPVVDAVLAAEERELLRPGVGDVAGDVQE